MKILNKQNPCMIICINGKYNVIFYNIAKTVKTSNNGVKLKIINSNFDQYVPNDTFVKFQHNKIFINGDFYKHLR